MRDEMKGTVVSLPNAKQTWETKIFSAFSEGNDVKVLQMIQEFYQLHKKKNTLQLLASLCHYHLGEEEEAQQFVLEINQIPTIPSKNELYMLYTVIFDDEDFWPWYEWIFSSCQDDKMAVWLAEWLTQLTPPRYKILRNVNQLQPKITLFVEQFSRIFLQYDDVGMQLAWLKNGQSWEKGDFFFEACQNFFMKDTAHPFVQTLLLQQLKFEKVTYYFQVKKEDKIGEFDLEKTDFPLHSLNERKMIREIQNYEAKNVSYAQQMLRVFQQYVMYFYPFVTEYPACFIDVLVRYTNEIFGQRVNIQALTDEEYQIYEAFIRANQPIFSS